MKGAVHFIYWLGGGRNISTTWTEEGNLMPDNLPAGLFLKVGTNEHGSACGRWLSIGIFFALW